MSFEVKAMGALHAEKDTTIVPVTITRRAVGPNDVHIKILKTSICHSDIHFLKQEWVPAPGKQVPGHEIVGVVVSKGDNVTNVAVGDYVGVGCMVGANCFDDDGKPTCGSCIAKDERYCWKSQILTYGAKDVVDGIDQFTYGGYSTDIVVNGHFACPIPEFYHDKLANVAPILCAGITVYSPLKRAGATVGTKVGVNGIGGLGRFAVEIAKALGCEVYAFTRSENKVEELKSFGVQDVILSTDVDQMKQYSFQLDLIIDTVSAPHDLDSLLGLLKPHGQLGLVGFTSDSLKFLPGSLIRGERNLFGSMIGSIEDTNSVLKLCADHKIVVPIEMIKPDQINEAYKRILISDVKYRFVIDIDELRK